jgi:hypothetical protein
MIIQAAARSFSLPLFLFATDGDPLTILQAF